MKNIKILFSLIVTFLSFFCTSKVLAISCSYTAEHPFDDLSTGINNEYQRLFKYVYMVKLGHSYEEYYDRLIKTRDNAYDNFVIADKNIKSISAMYNIDDINGDKITVPYDKNGENKHANYFVGRLNDFEGLVCPDIITLHLVPGSAERTAEVKAYYSSDNSSEGLISAFVSALSDSNESFSNNSTPLLLVSDQEKTKIELAAGYIYQAYYGINFVNFNADVDSVIKKYISIDGLADTLNKINLTIDSNTVDEETNQSALDAIVEQIKNEMLSFDEIESDIEILQGFDNQLSGGIFSSLQKYLEPYGITISEWYEQYMPNSPTKYIRALLDTLKITIESEEQIEQSIESINNISSLQEDYVKCTQHDHRPGACMELCLKFYDLKKNHECRKSSNFYQCSQSYPNNLCDNKSVDDIQQEMYDVKKEEEEYLKEELQKKILKYFEQRGIKIETTDFCDILLDKDKENGLYTYIKGILNVIRIGGPILVVVLTAFDAMKSISSFKDDENKKFWNHLKIRLICVAILILVPTIINFIVKLIISEACEVEI